MTTLKCLAGRAAAALGAILFLASPQIPDTAPSSPRTLLLALAGFLVAIGAYVAHMCEEAPPSPPPLP